MRKGLGIAELGDGLSRFCGRNTRCALTPSALIDRTNTAYRLNLIKKFAGGGSERPEGVEKCEGTDAIPF